MKKISVLICVNLWLNILFSQPQRIISLTPSITEQIYLLNEGKKLVGITNFCRKIYPEQQIVGTYLQPNVEKIVQLKPDLVLVSKEGIQKEFIEQIEKFKIKVITFDSVNNYNELKNQFLTLGKLFDKEYFTKKMVSFYEKKYGSDLSNISISKYLNTSILCVIGLEPLVVASTNSYIGEIIKYSSGKNCITTPIRYPRINIEEFIRLNPEVIIVTDMGYDEKYVKTFFSRLKNTVNAVKKNKIFIVDSNTFCQPTIKNFWLSVKKVRDILTTKAHK